MEPLVLPELGLTRTISLGASSSSHEQHHDFLPIASQYSAQRQSTDSYRSDDEAAAARSHALAALTKGSGQPSHPPVDRQGGRSHRPSSQSRSLNRASRSSLQGKSDSGHTRITSRSSISSMMNGPVTLPDDLEQVLTVISSGILEGHMKLVTALRKRYDEQFPLVRSLADVFTSHVSSPCI